jgi:predicted alpha/beta-hydrolase family hydrolase
LPLFAGGKSFGARMTSQAQAAEPLPGVRGLLCFGFPLHPAGGPSIDRARHLDALCIPILFLQGTRDTLAEIAQLEGVVAGLGGGATLLVTPEADHSTHVSARSGTTDAQVLEGLLDDAASWMRQIVRAE